MARGMTRPGGGNPRGRAAARPRRRQVADPLRVGTLPHPLARRMSIDFRSLPYPRSPRPTYPPGGGQISPPPGVIRRPAPKRANFVALNPAGSGGRGHPSLAGVRTAAGPAPRAGQPGSAVLPRSRHCPPRPLAPPATRRRSGPGATRWGEGERAVPRGRLDQARWRDRRRDFPTFEHFVRAATGPDFSTAAARYWPRASTRGCSTGRRGRSSPGGRPPARPGLGRRGQQPQREPQPHAPQPAGPPRPRLPRAGRPGGCPAAV